MFDILSMYNTSLNQTRTEISTFLMSLHLPEGFSSTLFAPAEWPSGFIIGQRASNPSPETSAGSSTPFGVTRNHSGSSTPLGLKMTSSTPDSIPLTTWQIQPLLPVSIQSLDKWNIIIFHIWNSPPTQPMRSFLCVACVMLPIQQYCYYHLVWHTPLFPIIDKHMYQLLIKHND